MPSVFVNVMIELAAPKMRPPRKQHLDHNIQTLERAINTAPDEDKQGLRDTLSILVAIQKELPY